MIQLFLNLENDTPIVYIIQRQIYANLISNGPIRAARKIFNQN